MYFKYNFKTQYMSSKNNHILRSFLTSPAFGKERKEIHIHVVSFLKISGSPNYLMVSRCFPRFLPICHYFFAEGKEKKWKMSLFLFFVVVWGSFCFFSLQLFEVVYISHLEVSFSFGWRQRMGEASCTVSLPNQIMKVL